MENEYDVHLFAVVRVKIPKVKADSMEDAIEKAANATDLHELLKVDGSINSGIESSEFAEEISSATVDVVGDECFEQTRHFHQDCNAWRPGATPRVLVSVSGGIAEVLPDPGVEIMVFDHDDYRDDPKNTAKAPADFADLAERMQIPCEKTAAPEAPRSIKPVAGR